MSTATAADAPPTRRRPGAHRAGGPLPAPRHDVDATGVSDGTDGSDAGAPGRLGHRPALDGVRTVAVYLVVAFHAGIGAFGGGFVGVDLFFVLSGFLVGGLLLDEARRTGRVRLRRFYARRVRRLLPAAVVAIVATAGVFLLVAPLARRLPLVGDGQAALLYVANWRFEQQTSYFRTDVDRSPFLHFWSLSIEEQFYIALPLLLVALTVVGRRWRAAVPVGLGLLFVASVGAQLYWAGVDPDRAYYGTDARVYQLLAGVVVAWWWLRRERAMRTSATLLMACAGLAGIVVCSLGVLGVSPSVRGLLATVASVVLVLGVVEAGHPVAALLSRPTITFLGRISYGTYLWHWPVVLTLLVLLDTGPVVILVLTAVLSTSLAALSYFVLEQPIRTSRLIAPFSVTTVAIGLAASVAAAFLVLPTLLEDDARPSLPASEAAAGVEGGPVPDIDWAAYHDDAGPRNIWCTDRARQRCRVHEGSSGLTVALIGDSQARMIAPAMESLAEEHDFTLYLYIVSACPWQEDVVNRLHDDQEAADCASSRDDLYDGLLTETGVDVALLAQQDRDGGNWLKNLLPAGSDTGTGSEEALAELNLTTMRATVDDLTAADVETVVLESIVRIPTTLPDPLECLSGARSTAECAVPATGLKPSDAFVRTIATESPDVATLTLNDLMCPDAPLCEAVQDGLPVWRDRDHYAPPVVQARGDELWDRLVATGFFDAGRRSG